jgi:hypothetical protein
MLDPVWLTNLIRAVYRCALVKFAALMSLYDGLRSQLDPSDRVAPQEERRTVRNKTLATSSLCRIDAGSDGAADGAIGGGTRSSKRASMDSSMHASKRASSDSSSTHGIKSPSASLGSLISDFSSAVSSTSLEGRRLARLHASKSTLLDVSMHASESGPTPLASLDGRRLSRPAARLLPASGRSSTMSSVRSKQPDVIASDVEGSVSNGVGNGALAGGGGDGSAMELSGGVRQPSCCRGGCFHPLIHTRSLPSSTGT